MVYQKKAILGAIVALLTISSIFMLIPYSSNAEAQSLTKEKLECISRQNMIARGQNWVDKHVPYDAEGKTYEGYRMDCSGFVSMCWELTKPGLSTGTIHTVSHNITKNDLQPGDALNCQNMHIVLFAGWSSADKTHYVAMEETNPSTGTVKKVIPYPYYYNTSCFHPIRYNSYLFYIKKFLPLFYFHITQNIS